MGQNIEKKNNKQDCSQIWFESRKEGSVIRKWFTEHGRELQPKPRFLDTATAQMSAMFCPNNLDLFDLFLHCAEFIVKGFTDLFSKFEVLNFHKLSF